MPRFYNSKDAPGTPQQGDLRYNESNNTLETYSGTAWGRITFGAVTTGALTSGDITASAITGTTLTADAVVISAGWVSLNTATPAFYLPAGAGAITGVVASLANRVPVGYNSTGRQIMVRFGGSWFTTASLSLA